MAAVRGRSKVLGCGPATSQVVAPALASRRGIRGGTPGRPPSWTWAFVSRLFRLESYGAISYSRYPLALRGDPAVRRLWRGATADARLRRWLAVAVIVACACDLLLYGVFLFASLFYDSSMAERFRDSAASFQYSRSRIVMLLIVISFHCPSLRAWTARVAFWIRECGTDRRRSAVRALITRSVNPRRARPDAPVGVLEG